MASLKIYGDTSGFLELKVPAAANNGTYNIVSGIFTTVQASSTITDSKGDVREVNRNVINSTPYTIPSGSSGEIFECRGGSGTVNINSANFSLGDIVTVYNHQGSTVTITFDTFSNSARIAGDTTNYSGTSITLATYGIATFICTNSGRVVVNGNVS